MPNEVAISAGAEPTDPAIELWLDPSDPGDVFVGPTGPTGPGGVPNGGLARQIMVKTSDAEGDAGWENWAKVTFGSTAPTAPKVGDVWIRP